MAASTSSVYIPDPRRWRILIVLIVALFMSLVGVSVVNVALPSIGHGLGATESELQWVLSGYALTFGIGLVSAGRAGDIYGRGPLFIAGITVFTVASIVSGFAQDPMMLNVSRAVQGIGSGLLNPQVIGMIQQYFRGEERGLAFGYFGSAVAVAVAVGPLIGGLLIQGAGPEQGWRWTFLINVPVGIAAIVLALVWFPKPLLNSKLPPEQREERESSDRSLDPVAAVILGVAVLAIMLPFVEGGRSRLVWWALPAGLALLFAWVHWERRQKRVGRRPMVDLAIFKVKSFTNGSVLITLYFMGVSSVWVIIALYMQDGLGHSALAAGLVGLPGALCSSVAAQWGGHNVAKHGRMVVIAGMYSALLGLVSSVLVVWLASRGMVSEWWLLLTLSFIGLAQGAVITPNQTLTLADVPLEYAGSSGGIMQTGQRIGTSVGIAVITALTFGVLAVSNWSIAFMIGFAAIIVVVALALLVAYADQRQRQNIDEPALV